MRPCHRASLDRADSPLLLLLCPLRFEQQILERHAPERRGDRRHDAVAIEVCGPGRPGIERWFARRTPSTCPARRGVLLVGTAGGLHPDLATGSAMLASRVVDAGGRSWTPTLHAPSSAAFRTGTLLSVDRPAVSPGEKARHRDRSGAAAVDLESAAFAEHCDARAWRWSVVRGISDDAAEPLPRGVAAWVDAEGRLRPLSLLASLLRSPRTIASLPRLRRQSTAALQAAAGIVAALAAAAAMETVR